MLVQKVYCQFHKLKKLENRQMGDTQYLSSMSSNKFQSYDMVVGPTKVSQPGATRHIP